jgi:hypothetical protein
MRPLTPSLSLKLVFAIALVALAIPASASAQATRTWVSGVGDDANPCSRTAPCKTFAGAISKTAAKGEINCLDPGGFGGVTITKSLTIKCQYTEGGVLVSGTNAIVINALASDKVVLRGLDINGLGTGLNGVRILSARTVHIFDSEIYQFTGAGIDVNPTSAQTSVVVARNHIHDTGIGILNAPGNNTITFTSVVARNNDIQDNNCGVAAGSFGQNGSTPSAATDCGTSANNTGISKPTLIDLVNDGINLNPAIGVLTRGTSATVGIAYSDITGNGSFGVHRQDSGHFRTFSPATNVIVNNGASDPPDLTVPLTKRLPRKVQKHGKRLSR